MEMERLGSPAHWVTSCRLSWGFGAVMLRPDIWGAKVSGNQVVFALFLGTAISISAMPMIARILMNLDLLRESIGSVPMCAAAMLGGSS